MTFDALEAESPSQLQVLIVEDESPIATTIAYIVEDIGLVPHIAPHGKAALLAVQHHMPDIVITDYMMPFVDGITLIAAIRDLCQRTQVPVPFIILTTAVEQKLAERSTADVILLKPFNIEQLEAYILTAIQRIALRKVASETE